MPLHPCGRIVDFIRTAYRTKMRLWADSEEVTAVRWFRAAPGAQDLPYENPFGSRTWEYAPGVSPLGEVPGERRVYDRGVNTVGYTGQDFCGARGAWEEGGRHGVDPEIELDDSGSAACCGRVGGVRLRLEAQLRAVLPHVAALPLRLRPAALQGGGAGIFAGRARLVVRLAALFPPSPPVPSGPALVVVPAARQGAGVHLGRAPLLATLDAKQGPGAGILDKRRPLIATLAAKQGPGAGILDKRRPLIATLAAELPLVPTLSFYGTVSANYTISGGAFTMTSLSGVVAGDIIVALIVENRGAGSTQARIPASFTRGFDVGVGTTIPWTVCWRKATAGEPSSYSVTAPGSSGACGTVWVIRGSRRSAPVGLGLKQATGFTSITAPPLSSAWGGAWSLIACVNTTSNPSGPATGYILDAAYGFPVARVRSLHAYVTPPIMVSPGPFSIGTSNASSAIHVIVDSK